MLKVVTFVLCLTVALAAVPHGKLPLAGHRNLMDFMVKSRTASQENPARSLDCFNYYIPILNGITDEYEQSYSACMKNAQVGYDQIDGQTKPARDEIESDAKAACAALANCAGYESSIDYFGCFSTEGSYNSKTMYNISANAGETLITVREQYRLVETEQFRCTNASERAYVENTASTYEELQGCLQGKSPVPTTAAPTSSEPPSTDTPTTEIPEGPTTAAPEDNNDSDKVASRNNRGQSNDKWQKILSKFRNHFY